mgnify:FL=1
MKPFSLIVEEFYSGDVYFDMDTDITHYNTVLRKPDYMFWVKGELGRVKYLTPDEYFIACAKMQHTTPEEQISHIEKDLATKYMDKMLDGEKFPMPLIDYISKRQEGRHRSFAARQIDPTMKMPVLLIFDANKTRKDLIQSVEQGSTYDEFKHLCQVYGIPHHKETWYNQIKNRTL